MRDYEHVVVCVDDTDDLTKETSTGAVAEALCRELLACGGVVELGVTRHQLLLDPRVRYTSHNSAMAFTAWLPEGGLAGFARIARETVWRMRAATSDPGLCVGTVPQADDAWLAQLLAYGFAAQHEYLTVASAYELAERVPWLELECLGGNEDGVVGALAGAGLRLSGNDGRFRGKCDLASLACAQAAVGTANVELLAVAPARDVLAELSVARNGAVAICDMQGKCYGGNESVVMRGNAKPVLRQGALTLVVEQRDGFLWPFAKDALDAHDKRKNGRVVMCPLFAFDNDAEEFAARPQEATCANCLYRRFTASGYVCMHGEQAVAAARA